MEIELKVLGFLVWWCKKKSDIQNENLRLEQKNLSPRNFIKTINDKFIRRKFHNDHRKINTKANRDYSIKDGNNKKNSYKNKLNIDKSNVYKEVRMFVVDKRNAETLIPIIQRHVLPGTEIASDEWRAYSKLRELGYIHYTVNHSKNFVDPLTKRHFQVFSSGYG